MSELLTSSQRRHLRGLAHSLEPVVRIGKSGLSYGLCEQIDAALEDHELIKIKFVDWKERKRELTGELCDRLDCQQVGRIGHTVILSGRLAIRTSAGSICRLDRFETDFL